MPFTFRPSVLALLSISLFLALWYGLAIYLNTITLPTPFVVANVLIDEINSGQLPYHLSKTLYRLLLSFSIAMLLGCAIGITLGRHKQLDCFFDNWLVIFLNVPALVTIILCYVWFGLVESAAILAVVINKLPNVIVTIREGTRALDKDLLDMAKCYRFSKSKTLRHVIWPQLHPFVMAATRSGLALIWKIVLVVEMLGRSDGMGYQLHLFFQLFDVASILAYTIAFVTLIQGIEILILKPLDKKAQRWRR
ncbi:NitT/TauT family transport system permease protein [Bathymodiolus platifrons methanotrophic gill symbiont]|uniref:ABC transporter permease n=1 Tax=Bathymodiolus platifrons methanotrophic gill symbiont TaxID=113268 RepID=UPI000B40820B|nr:ABC transporter permease [Bathymodiolus platifrons methanotrophic gill symbiont]MCK5869961.1 ABC transporter permease [Methyloprofundus sp.]TXK97271.1 ABC transporter permease [Methylococcaceae bacterium CS4]TXK97922.1 ABC transporter permease [Methylococcaceae bacterium CS5]TXL08650.1 ABC transporter permease [Methylococcaceae bacterium CS1]TXL08708.1 ABC transporter permease [Methylococcaceae bacterium CS3]TXL12292.1 ABC transporter permease [Methylococcaceae bacterium CS2]TXL15845.1 AB